MKIGLIGVGYISPAYINGCRLSDIIEIAVCADLNMDRVRAVAAEFNIPKAVTIDELLADPEIELVVNLTTPMAHAEITQRILRAGKHVERKNRWR
ncbi:MAG: Gfo/Idh/MocA family oxidoreductase [Anaerolineae bacterium]